MAEANIVAYQDQFSCPICLDLIKNPVSILCGHSFCIRCINGCWDLEDQKGLYSCPQCRQTFTSRPAVHKNTMLAEVVETLRKTVLQASRPDQCSAGPEDVECDSCTGRKSKAIKSCLVCLASYCETHLQPHYVAPAFKKHKLVDASRRLQERICSQHDKLLEVYCRTDQQCICMLCTMDEHKGHDTVSAEAGRAEKQKRLLKTQEKCHQRILDKEKEHQELTEAVEFYKRSAQTAVQEAARIFDDLIRSIETRRCDVTELIRAQEKAVVSRAEGVMKRLQQEIAELKRRDAEMIELLDADAVHFLQGFPSHLDSLGSEDLHSIIPSRLLSLEDVTASVSQLRDKVEKICHQEFSMVSNTIKEIQIIPLPEPRSRQEFLQYSCRFTLDPNTANEFLCVSERNTVVTCSVEAQSYSDHPDRFDYYLQVLCRESVCGRCYWEAEWSGQIGVSIAASYQDICRKGKGNECFFGQNDRSWRLFCSPSSYSFIHLKKEMNIPVIPSSSRIGVYVDFRAGILSFYSVSGDTMKLLHNVHTTFTQPLYPGFVVCSGSTIKL